MRRCLEEIDLYEVNVARTRFTWNGKKEVAFLPMADASETEDYMKNGVSFALVHAADNSFPEGQCCLQVPLRRGRQVI
jgi:hypothetical protein